jgi:hypothetical protein
VDTLKNSVQASTASFPGYDVMQATTLIARGLSEPLIGNINMEHVQLCPQNRGLLTDEVLDELKRVFPATQFRLHANCHVLKTFMITDASTFDVHDEIQVKYFRQVNHIYQRHQFKVYSLHAGYRHNCDMQRMVRNIRNIETLMPGVAVAVEGLYPNRRAPQLMERLDEYQYAYDQGLNVALDLSHLNLLREPKHIILDRLRVWLENPQTLEIHISDNNGFTDQHVQLDNPPFWWDVLNEARIPETTVIFSEGNHR